MRRIFAVLAVTVLALAASFLASGAQAQVVTTNALTPPMPVYNASGTLSPAAHMVIGSTTLTLGSSTVTFTGSAAFTSTSSYWCAASDTSSTASPTNAQNQSASSVRILSTDASAVINYVCVGT